MYDSIIAELKKIALDLNVRVILPKAPPITEAQQAEMDAYFSNPNRFIDYIGIIR